ncbi:MAG: FHA domain-containing protein [Planctomycetota bacterium]
MPELLQAPGQTPAATADGLLVLSVSTPTGEVQRHVLAVGKNTIGSGQRCRIQLQGDGVLPLHCLISVDGGGATVTSWGPGAELNGEHFGSAALCSGDRLVIGGHTLALDESPEVTDAEPALDETPKQRPLRAAADAVSESQAESEDHGEKAAALTEDQGAEQPSLEPANPKAESRDAPLRDAAAQKQPGLELVEPQTPPLETAATNPVAAVDSLRDLLEDPPQEDRESSEFTDGLESLKAAEVEGLRCEAERLNEEVAILRRQLAEKSAEAAGSARDATHLQTSLSETQDALAQALTTAALDSEETQRLEEEFVRLGRELEETREQIAEERAKAGELREEIAAERSEHVALCERLKSAEAERASAEQKAAEQTQALTAANSKIVELKSFAEKESELNDRIEQLEALKAKLEDCLKTAEAERDLMRQEQSAVEAHYTGLNEQIGLLQSTLGKKESEEAHLHEKISSLEAALRGSKEALEKATNQESQRHSEEAQALRAAEDAREQLRSTREALEQEGLRLAEAQAEAERQGVGLATAQEQLVELETENRGLRDEVFRLQEAATAAAGEIEHWQRQAEGRAEELNAKNAERTEQAGALAAVERELAEARAELESRKTADPQHAEQLRRLEATAEGLREELRSTRERLEDQTRERQAAGSELERLGVEKERSQEQLAELEQENRALRDESFGHQESAREAVEERDRLRNELSRLGQEVAQLQAADQGRDAAEAGQADQRQRIEELERLLTERDGQLAGLQAEFASAASETETVERLKQEINALSTTAAETDRRACETQEQLAAVQEALREREVSCAELEDARTRLTEQVEEMTHRLQAADWALEATEATEAGLAGTEDSEPSPEEPPAETPPVSELASDGVEDGREEAPAPVEAAVDPDPVADLFAAPAEEPSEEPEPFQPESFIDQYQHMLPDENEPIAPVPVDEERRQTPRPAGPADDDESALEMYMENLMRRVRGESNGETPPPVAVEEIEAPAPKPVQVDAAAARLSSVEPSVDNIVEEQAMSLEEWASTARKSQPSGDLNAMRELANSSARQAIATHSRQSLLESRVYQAIGCAILIGVGVYVLMSAPRIGLPVVLSAAALFGAAGWLGWRLTHCVVRNRAADPLKQNDSEARG